MGNVYTKPLIEDEEPMKKCTGPCGQWKPISEFYKNKQRKDGLQSHCKECEKEYNKRYRENNKEKIKERQKTYWKDNKETLSKQHKEHRKNNYIAYWVNYTLNKHKKRGITYLPTFKEDLLEKALEKPRCPICHRELEWYSTGTGKPTDLSPTLDRTHNDNYMDINNIDIICHKCNMKKNSETLEENLVWCKQFEEYANKKLRR